VCGTLAATPESSFCRRHESLAEKWGEERVMSGDYPGDAPRKLSAMVVESEPTAELVLVNADGDGGAGVPAAIRPALARLAADNLSELQRTLLEAALSATTTRWGTVRCEGCGVKSRVELPAPDVRSRLQAIQLLLSESLGRAPSAPEVTTPTMPRTAAEVQRMSWSELQYVFALTYADELAEATRLGGREALRAKLASLSEGERSVLREALAQSA
jgi:hypothetical protein